MLRVIFSVLMLLFACCIRSGAGEAAADPNTRTSVVLRLYVSPGGSDENSCHRGMPCLSFARAYKVARSGTVVEVAGGTYPIQILAPDRNRGADSVTFSAAPGEHVTVAGLQLGKNDVAGAPGFLTFKGINVRGTFVAWRGASHIVLEHLQVQNVANAKSAVVFHSSDHVVLEDVEVGPVCCSSDGIVFGKGLSSANPSFVHLDRVYVHDISQDCANVLVASCAGTNDGTHVDCVQFYGGINITIENSRFYRCANPQALFFGQDRNGTFSNVLVQNNMIGRCVPNGCDTGGVKFNTNLACGVPVRGDPILFSGYIHVYYNTIMGAIQFFRGCKQNVDPGTDIQVIGNIGYLSPGCNPGFGSWRVDHNLWTNDGYQANRPDWPPCGDGDRLGRATFVSDAFAQTDLHLRESSAGLGGGDPLIHPPRDIDGRPRPLRWPPDVGAAETDLTVVRLSRSIGMVTIGSLEADVRAAYGRPRRSVRRRLGAARERVRIATYLKHGGALRVTYDRNGEVVGVSTTSRYYTTLDGAGVGASARDIPNRFRSWNPCLHGWSTKRVPRVLTYFGAANADGTNSVRSIVILDRRIAPKCATAAVGRRSGG